MKWTGETAFRGAKDAISYLARHERVRDLLIPTADPKPEAPAALPQEGEAPCPMCNGKNTRLLTQERRGRWGDGPEVAFTDTVTHCDDCGDDCYSSAQADRSFAEPWKATIASLRSRLSEAERIKNDYAHAARVIDLHLGEFCVEHKATFADCIAEQAREAKRVITSLRSQLQRLTEEKKALVEGKVWPYWDNSTPPWEGPNGWRTSHRDPTVLGVETFASADEALTAYLTSISRASQGGTTSG